jgi:hypothetical protein
VELEETLPEANWVNDPELLAHLQLVPWLLLPAAVDAEASLAEGFALLDRFVEHRAYDQRSQSGGKWKSLALRAVDGDATKTQGSENYGSASVYGPTEIAALCPETMRWLQHLTDIDKCERIRFMLLEPGAEITVHSDAPEKDCSLAINIALNMPDGCDFWVHLQPDGSQDEYSKKIPILPATAFLFNTAPFHAVVNRSSSPRLHIIVHGPLRFTNEQLLSWARVQNGGLVHHQVLGRLWRQKVSRQGPLGQDSALYRDLMTVGLRRDSLPADLVLGLVQRSIHDELLAEESLRITTAGLYPFKAERLPLDLLDGWLQRKLAQGYRFAVIVETGVYIESVADFIEAVFAEIATMDAAGQAISGPILAHSGETPRLHEKLLLVNLSAWQKLGAPEFCPQFSQGNFPAWHGSDEHYIGNFTPKWLESLDSPSACSSKLGFGSPVLAAVLQQNGTVLNLSERLRATIDYLNPRQVRGENYRRVWSSVQKQLDKGKTRAFVFNTEPLAFALPDFSPELLVCPASGLKSIAIFNDLRNKGADGLKVYVIDHGREALNYYRRLMECESLGEVVLLQHQVLLRQGLATSEDVKRTRRFMNSVVREKFMGDAKEFMLALRAFREAATFFEADYLVDHEKLLSLLQPFSKILFWHSNAWEMNSALYRYLPAQLQLNYRQFVLRLARAHNLGAWLAHNRYHATLGPSFLEPQIFLTDGADSAAHPEFSHFENIVHPPVEGARRNGEVHSGLV